MTVDLALAGSRPPRERGSNDADAPFLSDLLGKT